jgi:DNA-binding response OmpR family regulator
VRKLRVKLDTALPGWSFIHTHFGFGYRLAAEIKEPNGEFTTH